MADVSYIFHRCFTLSAVDLTHRRVRRGVHWVHVRPPPPPPTWEKSSAQKCPKEERKFRPDMSAKKNVARSAQIRQNLNEKGREKRKKE